MPIDVPTSGSDIDVWSVVKVPYPYTDRPVRQSRPALVIARTGAETGLPLLWALMITSAENRGWVGDITISDLAIAGLPAASVVRTAKIATLNVVDATPLGCLPQADRGGVSAALSRVLQPIGWV